MQKETLDQWARENPAFKEMMERTVWIRYKAPVQNIHVHMDHMREKILDPSSPINDAQRECLADVLSGKMMPPQ